MGKMGPRDQNEGKKIGISGTRIYHVTTLKLFNTESELIEAREPTLDHRDFVYKG